MAQLPANARPLYRILTRKSRLGFGKYSDLYTVEDILKINPRYIVWVYSAFDKISFAPDILEELGCRQISKPGKDEEVSREWDRARSAQYTREERFHGWQKKKARLKAHAVVRLVTATRETTYTKGQLQAINHGHTKD